ncbi:hypothetical protein NOK12_25100 [Nocardioides sp. OK12]|nr:hypothetical protein NOK12_25100 [Nocardioides sp. OK12]
MVTTSSREKVLGAAGPLVARAGSCARPGTKVAVARANAAVLRRRLRTGFVVMALSTPPRAGGYAWWPTNLTP